MSTMAWRFKSTEGADEAVMRLKQLGSQDVIDVQDVAVIRWPQYASGPTASSMSLPRAARSPRWCARASRAASRLVTFPSAAASRLPASRIPGWSPSGREPAREGVAARRRPGEVFPRTPLQRLPRGPCAPRCHRRGRARGTDHRAWRLSRLPGSCRSSTGSAGHLTVGYRGLSAGTICRWNSTSRRPG
jgi:hypothetical protein